MGIIITYNGILISTANNNVTGNETALIVREANGDITRRLLEEQNLRFLQNYEKDNVFLSESDLNNGRGMI